MRRNNVIFLLAALYWTSPVQARDPYLLNDRSDEQDLFAEESSSSDKDLDKMMDEDRSFEYTPERWKRVRRAMEKGEEPEAEADFEPPEVSTITVTAPPIEPGLQLELPYESGLSISGRKLIGLTFSSKRFFKEDPIRRPGQPKAISTFDMKQELQVRIKGQVGRKVTVNVNFDDTKEDTRDISVVYKGDPDEIVQEAAFGDITLSLPSTRFVSYDKQLFGASTKLQYANRIRFYAVGSRTKGQTDSVRFTGSTRLESKKIADTDYIRRRYYQLTYSSDTTRQSHEVLPDEALTQNADFTTLQVFVDDQNGTNDGNTQNLKVANQEDTVAYQGNFDLLSPTEYSVDPSRGFIVFNRPMAQTAVLAVTFKLKSGGNYFDRIDPAGVAASSGPFTAVLIKDSAETPLITQELKTFYTIGRTKIVRDDGRGNFILRIVDKNDVRKESTAGVGYRDSFDNIEVDFETGIFNLKPRKFFPDPDPSGAGHETYQTTPRNFLDFFLEYRFRNATYSLGRTNIVVQSERVTLNGKVLSRDADYFIDYDLGLITFYNADQIRDDSVIDVTFEFSPFGTQQNQTLVGGRTEVNLTPSFSVGSTALYNFAAKPLSIPDIRNTPDSLFIYEGDFHIKDFSLRKIPEIGDTWVGDFPLKLASLEGEYAGSQKNPNVFGKALIESMEGIRQEDIASVSQDLWVPSANRTESVITAPEEAMIAHNRTNNASSFLDNRDELVEVINPQALDSGAAKKGDKQSVLVLNYDLSVSNETSVSQVLSPIGRDFSQKQAVEVRYYDDGSGNELLVDFGTIKEDSDGDAVCDSQGVCTFDTEDLDNDRTLSGQEDQGWRFGPSTSTARVGFNNGRIDSEDSNSNGRLDNITTLASTTTIVLSGPVGWKTTDYSLNVSTANQTAFTAVRQVRLTLRHTGAASGQIQLASLAVVGNRWENARFEVGSGTMTVSAINNENSNSYVPPFTAPEVNGDFNDLYPNSEERRKEQSLALRYNDLSPGTTASTRLPLTRAINLTHHKQFKFFLNNQNGGSNQTAFFLQVGASDAAFFEYTVVPTWTGWQTITLNLVDDTGDLIPDRWEPAPGVPGTVRGPIGGASFERVSQIKAGVSADVSVSQGEFWVDDIHMKESNKQVGQAKRLGSDLAWPNWSTFGGSYENVDRNFQTITSVVTNRDSENMRGYLNFTRLSFFPMNFESTYSKTVTPSVAQTGANSLVSILEEGLVTNRVYSGNGTLQIRGLPSFTLDGKKSLNKIQEQRRTDDNNSYGVRMADWNQPLHFFLLPVSLSAEYRRTNNFLSFDQPLTGVRSDNLFEFGDSYTSAMRFQFLKSLSFNPSYNLSKTFERRRSVVGDRETYPKATLQSAGFDSAFSKWKWFSPTVRYNVRVNETNVISSETVSGVFFARGDRKSIDRTADGNIAWNLSAIDLAPHFRATRTLTLYSSFQINDGDSYENLSRDVNTIGQFWIRQPLKFAGVSPTTARRRSLTERNTISNTARWQPFEPYAFPLRLSPLQSLSVTNNLQDIRQTTENFGINPTRTVTRNMPDLLFSLEKSELFLHSESFMGNSRLNVKTAKRTTTTINTNKSVNNTIGSDYRFTLLRKFDISSDFNRTTDIAQDLRTNITTSRSSNQNWSSQVGFLIGHWRLTPRYEERLQLAKDATGRSTQDLSTRGLSLQSYGDLVMPSNWRVPFTDKILPSTRLILNSTVKWERRASPINVTTDNTDNFTFTMSGDYEVSQNFRLTLSGGGGYFKNRKRSEDDYMSYDFGTTLNIQF